MKKDVGALRDNSENQRNISKRTSTNQTQICRQARKDASLLSQMENRLRRQGVQDKRLLTVVQEGVVFLLT